jgi:sugar phosphate isomerase/epimerase
LQAEILGESTALKLSLGLKSDPIEHRYSFEWLFELMNGLGLRYVQLGSFPELYSLEDGFFLSLKERAEKRGILIKSCFTSHRELGGFFSGDAYLERSARRNYERYIRIASLLGADSVGSNPGSVYRDRMELKGRGIECYLRHLRQLMALARKQGLSFLALEPMSCLAEPPALPEETDTLLAALNDHHRSRPRSTVPVYLCGDIGHGVVDRHGRVLHDNWSLFERQIPFMAEFHLKNTDALYQAAFGFSAREIPGGIVDLERLRAMIDRNAGRFPLDRLIGYLEIGGPKLGREYSDFLLRDQIVESVDNIRRIFRI